ncbi:MAG: NADH oxidase [Deltaproteobacteria bacterium]|jgi:NADPH2:quinone reductase|nr:NADH oxidase [Deltaproteobacteria bacterium]
MSSALQMQSLVREDGTLEVSLAEVETPVPGPDEVLVRIEAAPINPSDLGLLFGPADMSTASAGGTAERPVLRAEIPPGLMKAVAARVGHALPVGNEGAGIVVEAGGSDAAQALLGRTVAILGGSMYSQLRCVPAGFCLPLPEGTAPAEGASCFVNPLTALGMVETMKLEEHSALVHTAAASNLGQMLNKVCLRDGIPLVHIVRKAEHVELLKRLGAKHVCNSSDDGFMNDLTEALVETGATLAFDATGGGRLASQILTCMERAASRTESGFSRYGSTTHKQVYIYGGLDPQPTELIRNYGIAWGIGGWLLPPFLQRIGPARAQELREQVASEIKTTFASHYTKEVSLAEALQLEAVRAYGQQATGQKYLIDPSKGLS